MNIRILCVGMLKERYWTDAAKEYSKRLGKYCTLQIDEIKEAASVDEEGRSLLKRIRREEYVIVLAIKGKTLASEDFSKKLSELALSGNSSVVFVIGGSEGLSREMIDRADFSLSFSAMTFPHQMMRVFLLEQIYRGFKIMKNEKYHK